MEVMHRFLYNFLVYYCKNDRNFLWWAILDKHKKFNSRKNIKNLIPSHCYFTLLLFNEAYYGISITAKYRHRHRHRHTHTHTHTLFDKYFYISQHKFKIAHPSVSKRGINWLIDFKGISTYPELFYALRLWNFIYWTFILLYTSKWFQEK